MMNLSQVKKTTRKPWLVVGILLSLSVFGVGGCGTKAVTSSPDTSSIQSSTSSADGAATQDTTSSQENQSQNDQKPVLNPAIEATMSIRLLQENQQMVLSSDQKNSIKPILQLLIDTSNPSQEFLQQKAEAINAVFTEQQKTFLSTNTKKGNPNGKSPDGTTQVKDREKVQSGAPTGNQPAPAGQSQDIFTQVLASLT